MRIRAGPPTRWPRRWAQRVPDARDSLDVAARTFDEVRYGGRPGSPAAYRSIADADDRVAVGAVVGSGVPAVVGSAPGQPLADARVVDP